ncbi:tryptophan synthase subunit alpha [Longispora sp. NPDC051575]|uniref:tryptophan synthase subunit alpha n=1 Tax=Longispora sp. NPDC051575 TaxID=3154943 RepID=UPI00342343EA
MTGRLENTLRAARDGGRKLLIPYVTGGVTENWTEYVDAALEAGADAVEIGVPFSDPAIDGPVIQRASVLALERGTTVDTIVDDLVRGGHDRAPLIAMTYYNLVLQPGHKRFAERIGEAGICATILPDLPHEESGEWEADASAVGIEHVLLASPVSSDERLAVICERTRGFVYGLGLMGVTGERSSLAESSLTLARRLKAITDKPVLIGVGVSTPANATQICQEADGVIIGAPVMRRIVEGESPAAIGTLVADFRKAIGG